ncbi:MAG TPA: hypothetical protein PLD73_05705 [Candidatus Hydrogenedentes bacterium]|nr:hypothetical protein [Candidatus Hydrogenedentota bacterium]
MRGSQGARVVSMPAIVMIPIVSAVVVYHPGHDQEASGFDSIPKARW